MPTRDKTFFYILNRQYTDILLDKTNEALDEKQKENNLKTTIKLPDVQMSYFVKTNLPNKLN